MVDVVFERFNQVEFGLRPGINRYDVPPEPSKDLLGCLHHHVRLFLVNSVINLLYTNILLGDQGGVVERRLERLHLKLTDGIKKLQKRVKLF